MSTNTTEIMEYMSKISFDNLIASITKEYLRVCNARDLLAEKLKSWNKDEEIEAARKETQRCKDLSIMQCSYPEMERIKQFHEHHYHSCGNGNCYQYELTGTEIGTVIKIRCPKCGHQEDITDYTVW